MQQLWEIAVGRAPPAEKVHEDWLPGTEGDAE
jgi:hypothetical protein